MLSIKNLYVSVKKNKILNGLNLDIKEGELHVIMGRNGSGKSTLANVVAGQENYSIDKGKISYYNENLLDMEVEERAAKGIFMSFQYPVEIPGINNAYFLRSAMNSQQKFNNQKEINAPDFMKEYKKNMEHLDLDKSFLSRSLNEGFSGGEKKRNEMLQMLMLKPKLCILDETDSGLDVDALAIISKSIQAMRTNNRSFIIITHYHRILEHLDADHVHILSKGKIVKTGGKDLAIEIEQKGFKAVLSS
jgi:Fe-S cluster assembly ATP-binding protein|tara:strand:+ start:2281 stop:3024 length:744 start_codon:yes stop_codon:yes gene_type:complete